MAQFENFVSTLNSTLSAESVLNKFIERLESCKKIPKDYALLLHPDKLEINTSQAAEYLKSRKDAQGNNISTDFYFKGLDAWIKKGEQIEIDEDSEVEPDDGQTRAQLKAQEKDFINAAQSGMPDDLATVKKLFSRSSRHKYLFNINAQNKDGYTALMMAVANNHLDIVKVLLQPRYKNTNLKLKTSQGETVLELAVKSQNKDCVKLLLHVGATPFSQENKETLAGIKPFILEELQESKETQEINFYTLKLCTQFFPDINLESECVISSACATQLLTQTLHKFNKSAKNHTHYEKMALWLIAHEADLMFDPQPNRYLRNNISIPITLFDTAIQQENKAIIKATIKKGAQLGLSVSVGLKAPESKYIKKLVTIHHNPLTFRLYS